MRIFDKVTEKDHRKADILQSDILLMALTGVFSSGCRIKIRI